MNLDSFDRAILALVQRDNQLTHAARRRAGEPVANLGASDGLARLRKEGVIQADVSIVDADKTAVTAIVEVSFEKETLKRMKRLSSACAKPPKSRSVTPSRERWTSS